MNMTARTVLCPHCGAKMQTAAPAEKQVRCPKCREAFQPAPAPTDSPGATVECTSCQAKLKGIKPGTKFKCPKCGSIERAAPAGEPSQTVSTPKKNGKSEETKAPIPKPIKPISKPASEASPDAMDDEPDLPTQPRRISSSDSTPGTANTSSMSKRNQPGDDDEDSSPRISTNLLATLFILVVIGAIVGAWSLFSGDSGPDRAAIAGEVTIDGAPVGAGTIHFITIEPKGKTIAVPAAPIEGGRFNIPREQGPSIGMCKVEIRVQKKTGQKIAKFMGAPEEAEDEIVEGAAERFNVRSELTFDAKAGSNTVNFQVSSR